MKLIRLLLLIFLAGFLYTCGDKPTAETSVSIKNDSVQPVSVLDTSLSSEITCPQCGFKKTETMPTDICLLSYTCEKCKTVLHPEKGDCCVFCTYGDQKCPSMQE